MSAVAKVQEAEVIQADATSLMAVISRAASDPSTDVDKLERLMGMYERITGRQAEQAYNDAMNAAQAQMGRVRTDAHNPQTRSRYASYPALDAALRPIYTANGFSLSFYTGEGAPADHIRLFCKVAHRDGHAERPFVDMPADGKGAKGGDVMTKTHAAGAAMSYGQRYLLKLIFNIAVGEDTDGNMPRANVPQGFVTEAQAGEIQAIMEDVGADRDGFLKYMKADSIATIAAKDYDRAISALNKKRGVL